jgi:zinc protease
VIGWMEDLDRMELAALEGFFREHYTPSNASLAVVGAFDPGEARELAHRFFGAIPPGPPRQRLGRWVPRLDGVRRLTMEDRVSLPLVVFAWPTVPAYAPDAAALDAFAEVFGAGKTGRLFKSLVYERQIAQNVYATHLAQELSGALYVYCMPRPGTSVAQIHEALHGELLQALAAGVDHGELERVIAARTAAAVKSLERRGGFGGRADHLNAYLHYVGEPDFWRGDLQRYLDLDVETVNETARRHLGPDRAELVVEPRPPRRVAVAGVAGPDERATLPGPMGPPPPLRLPVPELRDLRNGSRLVALRHGELPLLELAVLVPYGSAYDPPGRPGLADLTAAMLEEGTARRSSLELASELKRLGSRLTTRVGDDFVAVRLSALETHLEPSLELLAEVVRRPALAPEELERQRQERLTSLLEQRDNPEAIATKAAYRALYGAHPYAHPRLGSEEFLRSVDIAEVDDFYARHFNPRAATVVAVGSPPVAHLADLLERVFAGWESPAAPPPVELPAPPPHPERRLYLVDRPGAAQSVVAVVQLARARRTPDYLATRLANHVFGGFFSSRLNMNLREAKGYTYGARSAIYYGRVAGPLLVWAPVDTGKTAATVAEMLRELDDAAGARPFTADEVEFARGNLAAAFPMGFETPGQILSQLADLVTYELPPTEHHRFVPEIEALGVGEVNAAAADLFRADGVAVVVVGDGEAVLPDLERLDLGPLVRCDLDGVPIGVEAAAVLR